MERLRICCRKSRPAALAASARRLRLAVAPQSLYGCAASTLLLSSPFTVPGLRDHSPSALLGEYWPIRKGRWASRSMAAGPAESGEPASAPASMPEISQ